MSTQQADFEQINPPIIVIFGITGDLSQRYLLPALYHLIKDGALDPQAEIVGISRRDVSAEQLFEQVELCVNEIDKICDPVALKAIQERTRMMQMDLDDPAAYANLRQTLNAIEEQKGICMNRLYYLSIPPKDYRPIIAHMGTAGLNTSCQHDQAVTRLLVEKPFGFDLHSAEELIAETATVFSEEQIFRIDHFLAKNPVQQVLEFRFQQPALDEFWNHQHIASIEISAAEQITIEGRVTFYEQMGALRDFIQNHLLQLLALVTMDRPEQLNSSSIHAVKETLLQQVQPIPADVAADRVIRGQYEGYREEVDNPESMTETYAGITVYIDNPRWQNVPLSVWTGKALAEKNYEITLQLCDSEGKTDGSLHFHIQPDKGIEVRATGSSAFSSALQAAVHAFSTSQRREVQHPDAYEQVLTGAIRGDHALFASSEEIVASWQIVQPVLTAWSQATEDLIIYPQGTKGPLVRNVG